MKTTIQARTELSKAFPEFQFISVDKAACLGASHAPYERYSIFIKFQAGEEGRTFSGDNLDDCVAACINAGTNPDNEPSVE